MFHHQRRNGCEMVSAGEYMNQTCKDSSYKNNHASVKRPVLKKLRLPRCGTPENPELADERRTGEPRRSRLSSLFTIRPPLGLQSLRLRPSDALEDDQP